MSRFLGSSLFLAALTSALWGQGNEDGWQLTIPLDAARLLPASQKAGVGIVADAKTLNALWKASNLSGSPAPKIDFTTSVLVFARNENYFNTIKITAAPIANGVANPQIVESRTAIRLDSVKKLNVALKAIPRAGLKSVRTESGEVAVP